VVGAKTQRRRMTEAERLPWDSIKAATLGRKLEGVIERVSQRDK